MNAAPPNSIPEAGATPASSRGHHRLNSVQDQRQSEREARVEIPGLGQRQVLGSPRSILQAMDLHALRPLRVHDVTQRFSEEVRRVVETAVGRRDALVAGGHSRRRQDVGGAIGCVHTEGSPEALPGPQLVELALAEHVVLGGLTRQLGIERAIEPEQRRLVHGFERAADEVEQRLAVRADVVGQLVLVREIVDVPMFCRQKSGLDCGLEA